MTIGVLSLLTIIIIVILGYIFSAKFRSKLLSFSYFSYMSIIGILSTIATISVLIYQFYFALPVCELCWWQRIFMFPIEFIVASTIIQKSRGNHLAIAGLSLAGAGFAAHHYWNHLTMWVFKTDLVGMQCSGAGGSCSSTSGIMTYGFMSIPGMALIVFIVILALCFLAAKQEKLETNLEKIAK